MSIFDDMFGKQIRKEKKEKAVKPVKERIQMLVDALRSGRFKQGTDILRPTRNTYCCLGVAMCIYQEATGDGRWTKDKYNDRWSYDTKVDNGYGCMSYLCECGELTENARKWFGFSSSDPKLKWYLDGEATTAVRANDQGAHFEDIALCFENTYIKSKRKTRA